MANTILANVVILDTGCHLIHNKGNAFCSFGRYSVAGMKDALDLMADKVFVIEYRTSDDAKEREKDHRKYSKRVESLGPLYVRGPWKNRVINGNVFPNVFECIVNKIGG